MNAPQPRVWPVLPPLAATERQSGNKDYPQIPIYREDSDAVFLELKKRNRAYIKEFYGEELPLDFDFKARYENSF